MFNNSKSRYISPTNNGKNEQNSNKVVRTAFYLFSYVLLFGSTVLILISLFTHNWMKTLTSLANEEYYSFGLWFNCRYIFVGWVPGSRQDVYCTQIKFETGKN